MAVVAAGSCVVALSSSDRAVLVCAVARAAGTAVFLPLNARVALCGFAVLCAPPELDTVTPGATSTVDDVGDLSAGC